MKIKREDAIKAVELNAKQREKCQRFDTKRVLQKLDNDFQSWLYDFICLSTDPDHTSHTLTFFSSKDTFRSLSIFQGNELAFAAARQWSASIHRDYGFRVTRSTVYLDHGLCYPELVVYIDSEMIPSSEGEGE
jgi:hypothetical protein